MLWENTLPYFVASWLRGGSIFSRRNA